MIKFSVQGQEGRLIYPNKMITQIKFLNHKYVHRYVYDFDIIYHFTVYVKIT